jgi:uncharacterized protein (UPF0335 family)
MVAATLLGKPIYCGEFNGSEKDPCDIVEHKKVIDDIKGTLSAIVSLDAEKLVVKDNIDVTYANAKAEGLSCKALKEVVKMKLNPQLQENWEHDSPVIDQYMEIIDQSASD